MSVNNIAQYSNVKETIASFSVGSINDMKKKKEELKSLFEGEFATMGANTEQTKTIENEIKELEALIAAEQAKIYKYDKQIFLTNDEISVAKEELDKQIVEYVVGNERHMDEQRAQIQMITQMAIDMYAAGQIGEDDVAATIQSKVAAISTTYDFPQAKVSSLQNVISEKVQEITDLMLQKSMANTKISTATSALTLLNEMYQVQILALGERAKTKANGKPVYTPKKQEFVDEMYAKYHSSATAGVDQYSIGNQQVQKIADALGLKNPDGSYSQSSTGQDNYENSMLQEMHKKGFTLKEAMVACEYIFGTSKNLLSYDPNANTLVIAYGHGGDGAKVLNSFKNQAETIWGQPIPQPTEPTTPTNTTPTNTTPTNTTPTNTTPTNTTPTNTIPTNTIPTNTTPTNTEPTKPTVQRTDPIGWYEGNTSYDFVIDRNNDGKFDGPNEFLGADNGWSEMIALDDNNDGFVDANEMTAHNVLIMSTNHENKAFGFLTGNDAGVAHIDLASFKQVDNPHANVNDNIVKGTFNLTLNNRSVTGYQSEDDNQYLAAVYGDRYNKSMSSKIDYSKTANKEALANIESTDYVTEDEIKKLKASEAKALSSFNTKKADAEKEVKVAEEELKQDLRDKIRRAERAVDELEEKRESEEAQNEEYEKRNIETPRTALNNRKATIEAQLEDLYNDNDSEENADKIEELETELNEVELKLDALDNKYNA